MRILVTNDDGIYARGLWALAEALRKESEVIVVAPDRERSAIGTAVTLRQPLQVQSLDPPLRGVEAYSVDGTPSDSVILALTRLVDNVDLVISGINHGPNVGDDVLISGTVGAALQGYLYGLPAIAISVDSRDSPYLDTAARLAALLARRVETSHPTTNIFLNVNLPNLPLAQIERLEITSLAHVSHTNAAKEDDDSKEGCYRLLRQKIDKPADSNTDVWAIERGIISITPLHARLNNSSPSAIPDSLHTGLLQELRQREKSSDFETGLPANP